MKINIFKRKSDRLVAELPETSFKTKKIQYSIDQSKIIEEKAMQLPHLLWFYIQHDQNKDLFTLELAKYKFDYVEEFKNDAKAKFNEYEGISFDYKYKLINANNKETVIVKLPDVFGENCSKCLIVSFL